MDQEEQNETEQSAARPSTRHTSQASLSNAEKTIMSKSPWCTLMHILNTAQNAVGFHQEFLDKTPTVGVTHGAWDTLVV